MRRFLLLAVSVLSIPALSAGAQPLPPEQGVAGQGRGGGSYGCEIEPGRPCQGRVDFEVGHLYEFRIKGPGTAAVVNEGNRRCTLEYSLSGARLAVAGRTMNLAPGQAMELPDLDAAGVTLRFFNRGFGSNRCDLTVALVS